MQTFGKFLVATAALLSPVTVLAADDQPAPDVNYDCALFDECGQDQDGAQGAKPAVNPEVRSSNAVRGGFTIRKEPAAPTSGAKAAILAPSRKEMTGSKPARIAKPSTATPSGRMQAEAIRAGQQITFVSGSAVLSPTAKLVAQKLAASMLRPDKASLRYRIEGHTDAVGTRERNLELSKQRAEAVVAYLGTLGVDTKKLEVAGYGFDQPLPGVPKTSGANRRVVAKVIN